MSTPEPPRASPQTLREPTPFGETGGRFVHAPGASKRRRVQVNLPLRFCHEVLGLDNLHYGLWDGEHLDIEGLKGAQKRYTEHLIEWIPPQVESILDVGSGTGATGRLLRDRGYEVEGLSPDPYQQRLFERRVGHPFHLGRFQEFEPPHPYDLVLMSESSQYIWLDSLFPAVRRTAPGGHLLVADYFVVGEDTGDASKSGHPLDAYLEKAAAAGLELVRQEDVTEQALPTLELATAWVERYVDPSLTMFGDHLAVRYPRLFGLARRLFGRRIERHLAHGRAEVSSVDFRRLKRYQFLLFRIVGSET